MKQLRAVYEAVKESINENDGFKTETIIQDIEKELKTIGEFKAEVDADCIQYTFSNEEGLVFVTVFENDLEVDVTMVIPSNRK